MHGKSHLKILFCMIAVLWIISGSAGAVRLTPEAVQKMRMEERLQEYVGMMVEAKSQGVDAPDAARKRSHLAATTAEIDTANVLVLLVDFADKPYTVGYVAPEAADFDSILFSTGLTNPTGSMTEFYMENSYGKFFIRGEVHGWYRMPQNYSYYVNGQGGIGMNYPYNSQGLTYDAIMTADAAGMDFSQFDSFGDYGTADGEIDGLLIVHAGVGLEQTGNQDDMQSHKWNLNPAVTIDGMYISAFTIQPEEYLVSMGSGVVSPIGVFCHEYGHVLGLPDLYDIDYSPPTSAGIGIWSLMGTGNYKTNSKKPAHFDAWCKSFLGYVDPIEVYDNLTDVEIPQVESEPVVYRIWAEGVYGNQYFLVENRQAVGFDVNLPGSGLMIYHVDDNATFNNTDVNHYHVAVEQADGLFQLEFTSNNEGDGSDTWPGMMNKRSFDDRSVPSSRSYALAKTRVSVWNISDSDSLMTANLDIRWSRPFYYLDDMLFSDENGNYIMEAGEEVEFYFGIQNYWLTTTDVTVTLTCNDDRIVFSDSTASFATMEGDGGFTGNISDPIVFQVPDTLTPVYDTFFVNINSDGGLFDTTIALEQQVGKPQILLVDDDRGADYDTIFVGDLYKRLIPVDVWDKAQQGSPSAADLGQYRQVFWFTGDTATDLLQAADIEAMKGYLDVNGNLFLTGQTLAGELHAEDSAFLENYLHARYDALDFWFEQTGEDESPIGSGLKIRYPSSSNQIFNLSEAILPVNGAIPAFKYPSFYGGFSSLSYSGSYKLVFFNFGYEALTSTFLGYDKRDTVLNRVLDFFASLSAEVADDDRPDILPSGFKLAQNYPNPFNARTAISYRLYNNHGRTVPHTNLRVYNSLGQVVRTLVDRPQRPGEYTIYWDGLDDSGRAVASGIYFCRLLRGSDQQSMKMIYLK